MKTEIRYAFYALTAGLLLVPFALMGGAGAYSPSEDGCGALSGVTAYTDNAGDIDFDSYNICLTDAGVLDGASDLYAWNSNLGRIYFDHVAYTTHSKATPVIDVNDDDDSGEGEWSGYLYAPMNVSDWSSTAGAWFDLTGDGSHDGVSTDLLTGNVTGYACSDNIGCIEFTGARQDLPEMEILVDMEFITFGDFVEGGVPVGNGEGTYTMFLDMEFPEFITLSDSFLADDFEFELGSGITPTAESDVRLIAGEGVANDALIQDTGYSLDGWGPGVPGLMGDWATYYLETASLAPTGDQICRSAGEFEFCNSGSQGSYTVDTITLSATMPRDFVWVFDGVPLDTTMEADGTGTATVSIDEDYSFAPLYEIDNFGLEGVAGPEDMPTLALGDTYNFVGDFVLNGSDADVTSYAALFEYSLANVNPAGGFTFGSPTNPGGCQETTPYGSPPIGEGSLNGVIPTTGVRVCAVDESEPLDDESDEAAPQAQVNSYVVIRYVTGEEVIYPSQLFSFVDSRIQIDGDRVWVTGTVSGLAEGEDVTVVGSVSRLELRDQIYESVMEVVRGVGDVGGGYVDFGVSPVGVSQGISLVNDTVFYFTDDVKVGGGTVSGVGAVTMVVEGGDVYLAENLDITDDSNIGIIVLEDDSGNGGNLYVYCGVTDVYANIFLDGSFVRGSTDALCTETDLTNQLYLKGSLVSQNTIKGYDPDDENGDGVTCTTGDGETGDCTGAEQQDLNYASYFQACYPQTYVDGILEVDWDATYEDYTECPGFEFSNAMDSLVTKTFYWYYPSIIEYSPPASDLPVFSVAGGISR